MPDDPRLVRNDTLRTIFTPLAIIGSAIGVGLTIWHSDQLQRRQAEADFQLQAARIVMAEPDCASQVTKARQLRNLFPNRLPIRFGEPQTLFQTGFTVRNGKIVAPPLPCPK